MMSVLGTFELQMLRRVDNMREHNIIGEPHLQSYRTSSSLVLGGFWLDKYSTLFSIRKSIESKTRTIRKYSVVL